jgi:transcriptional regulator with XRE-family HTH domain
MTTKHEALAAALAASGMTQADLARRINTPPQHVNNWLRGRRPLSLAMIDRIAAAIGQPIRWDLESGKVEVRPCK